MIRPVVLHAVTPEPDPASTAGLIPLLTATRALTCTAFGAARIPDRQRPELFHAHDVAGGWALSQVAARCGRPFVVTVTRQPHDAERQAIRRAALVICPAGSLAAQLRDDVDPERLWVMPEPRRTAGPLDAAWLAGEPGAVAADLEAHYLALIASGRPAPQRPPRTTLPTVSVVMITHNRRRQLARTLDALREQTYPPHLTQVVVVDNASTDGSAADLSRLDERFVVLRETTHAMPVVARNRGIAVATGDIVAFTDDDCYPTPGWLATLVAGFRTGVGIVQGRTVADPTGELTPLARTQWTPAEYGLYETANVAYLREHAAAGFDEGFARELAAALGRRFARYPFGEDVELAWRIKRQGVVSRFASTALVHHHVWPADLRYQLRRAVIGGLGFPRLVRDVPELRDGFLWRRYFLSKRHAALSLVMVAAVAGRRRPAFLAAGAAPYLWQALQPRQRGRRRRLVALPAIALRDCVEVAATVVGAVRAREPLL